MGEVFFLHRIPLPSYGIQSSLHVDGVPNNHRVGQQIQTSRLIRLAVLIFLAHYPFACKEEECAEIVELFPCVELSVDAAAQEAALRAAGVERIFTEAASGGRWDRPVLQRLLDQLRLDDIGVVWKLDRLSRSLKDLLHLIERIERAQAGFRSLTDAIDTTSPAGRMLLQMVGSIAEFERAMIRERTRAGLAAARAQGRVGGRRPRLRPHQQTAMVEMARAAQQTQAELARLFNNDPTKS